MERVISCRAMVQSGAHHNVWSCGRSEVLLTVHGLGFRRGLPPLRPLMRDCSRPASEVGPVLSPPWSLHRPLAYKTFSLQALPALVVAPQVKPCNSSGKAGNERGFGRSPVERCSALIAAQCSQCWRHCLRLSSLTIGVLSEDGQMIQDADIEPSFGDCLHLSSFPGVHGCPPRATQGGHSHEWGR